MSFGKIGSLTLTIFMSLDVRCFVLNSEKDNLKKFDTKSDEGIFLGYFTSNKMYRIINKQILVVEESIHMIFDEANDSSLRKKDTIDDDAGILENGIKELSLKGKSSQEEK